jgi:hypothetical protein
LCVPFRPGQHPNVVPHAIIPYYKLVNVE